MFYVGVSETESNEGADRPYLEFDDEVTYDRKEKHGNNFFFL
jgi:hypothetical protein